MLRISWLESVDISDIKIPPVSQSLDNWLVVQSSHKSSSSRLAAREREERELSVIFSADCQPGKMISSSNYSVLCVLEMILKQEQ